MFISILCLFLSGPSPCNLFTQRGHPEITHFARAVQQIPNASCPPPPLDSGSCAFFLFFFSRCYDNEMCSITMTKLCMCLWMMVEFMWIKAPLHIFAWIQALLHNVRNGNFMTANQIFFPLHLWSNCPINWHQIVVIKFWCVVLSVQEVHRV